MYMNCLFSLTATNDIANGMHLLILTSLLYIMLFITILLISDVTIFVHTLFFNHYSELNMHIFEKISLTLCRIEQYRT